MSKKTDERPTPDDLFNLLNDEFHFEIDLAASDLLHKLPNYYTKVNSAFNHKWTGVNFCNPPYSNIIPWLNYGSEQNACTVYILPCDTSTRWFHDYLWNNVLHKPIPNIQLRFPRGRFKFGKIGSPKFATIIAVMENRNESNQ